MKRAFVLLTFLALARAAFAADKFWRSVSWQTPDGVVIAGLYHRAEPGRRVWVLLHGLGSTKEEWDGFCRQLAPAGEGCLIYDARGHGQSNKMADGTGVSYTAWQTVGEGSPWSKMVGDAGAAEQTLTKRFDLSERRIAWGGASLGANVALAYAAEHPKVPALILLSPGQAYAGIDAVKPFQDYGRRPLFMAAGPGDSYAFQSVRGLAGLRRDSRLRVAEGPGAAHGVAMFEDAAFTKKLIAWIKGLP